jgi:MFS family permease
MEPKQPRRNYFFGMEQVRRFILGAKVSACLLVFTSAALVCTSGVNPLFPVDYATRDLISLVWFWNVGVFAVCGGMVLAGWLIDRFGDRPDEDAH